MAEVYVIYPIIDATSSQTDTIQTMLERFLPNNPTANYTSKSINLGVISGEPPLHSSSGPACCHELGESITL